jgi:hypothetical protein
MKATLVLTGTLLALTLLPALRAEQKEQDHKHEHKVAGPNGGRVLHSVEPHCEFFVRADRKLQVTFLGEDGKAIAPAAQTVSAIGGERSKPTKFSFTKMANTLVSDVALPEGNRLPIVITIKNNPNAKPVVEKFAVDLSNCPTCEYREYACTCDHEH